MRLFKYYDENKFKLAFKEDGLSIRISQIDSLNDPFESKINLSSIFGSNASASNNKTSIKEKKKNIDISFRKVLNEKFGIISLTSTSKNRLMWSHYTNSYKGFCIELDIEYEEVGGGKYIKSSYSSKLIKVKYAKKRIKYITDILKKKENVKLDYMFSIMSTKDAIWKYENEYRIISSFGKKIHHEEIDGLPLHTMIFSPSHVKRIIFGTLCTQSNIEFVKNWIQSHNATHIILSQLELCEDSYELNFNDL